MKATSRSSRRLLAAVAGLAVGLGGALAIGSSPAQAEEYEINPDTDRRMINCQTLTVSPDRSEHPDGKHAWRVVFRTGDQDEVVWRSGDWQPNEDLGDDEQALIDKGWAANDFTETVDLEGLPNGTFLVQYWAANAGEWRNYTTGKPFTWVRQYEKPCGWVPPVEVTQPTCEAPAVIEIPDVNPDDYKVQDLTYTVNGEQVEPGPLEVEPGTYEVVGYRVGGKKDYVKKWTVEIAPPDCPTPSPAPTEEPGGGGGGLPETGASTGIIAGGALGLLGLGGGLYLLARRRRITFTA